MTAYASKTSSEELACLGGVPLFAEKRYVGRPSVGDRKRFMESVEDILDRQYFTNAGPYVAQLERAIEDRLGVKHCIAMCNGTVALEIAIRALELSGEVIVPSFTFVACAHALQWQRVKPVFCDISPDTHTLDPAVVEAAITPETTGIMGVHLWGKACDTDALRRIADQHNLRLLYDASHAFACSHNGRMLGTFGDAAVFSFHATKFFHTFEGGAVVTQNDTLAEKIRLMKNFGFQGFDHVVTLGINGKMNEISAAMGLAGLAGLDETMRINRANYEAYRDGLVGIPGVNVLSFDGPDRYNHQYLVVEIDKTQARVDRDRLVDILHAENLIVRRYFYPGCHRMEPYRTFQPEAGENLPVTEAVCDRVICFPTGPSMSTDDIGAVCELIRFVMSNSEQKQT